MKQRHTHTHTERERERERERETKSIDREGNRQQRGDRSADKWWVARDSMATTAGTKIGNCHEKMTKTRRKLDEATQTIQKSRRYICNAVEIETG